MIPSTRLPKAAVLAAAVTMTGMVQFRQASAIAGEKNTDITAGRDVRYVTQDAMYLANEEWYLYSCSLPENQADVGSNFDEDSYWYSRYNLGNLLFRSIPLKSENSLPIFR